MRILIACAGSHGDIHPFIAIGSELRRRGHEVILSASGYFADLAQTAGLEFVAIGSAGEFRDAIENPDLWHPRRGSKLIFETIMAYTPLTYQQMLARYQPGNTVMVASTLAFAARLLQETHALPLVSVHLAPSIFRSAYQSPKLPGLYLPNWLPKPLKRAVWYMVDRYAIDPLICPALNRYRAELGLAPVRRVFDQWLHSPDRVIGLFPAWFNRPQPDWPPQLKLTGFPLFDQADKRGLPHDVCEFLDAGPAPVVFAPGSAMLHGERFFAESIAACQQLGQRALLVTLFSEQIPQPLPTGVCHFDYVPFSQLLPHAAALVHHGGIGSCSQALCAGIPQLIRPLAYDQFDNAARLVALGVARKLKARDYYADNVATILESMLSSTTLSEHCRTVAERFAGYDAIARSCDWIEAAAVGK
jgi:UDP:flavonoid glycosyltransferase YjiC (YdhE family)